MLDYGRQCCISAMLGTLREVRHNWWRPSLMTYSDTHNWAPSWCSGKLNPFVSKFRCVIASQTVNSHNSSINKSQARLLAVEHEWRHFVSKLVHGITSRPRNRNSEQTRKGPAVAFRRKAVKHDMMCVVCGCAAVLHRWHTRSACSICTFGE